MNDSPLIIRLKYRVLFDYDKSVEELLADGKYDGRPTHLQGITTQNFPSSENGKIEREILLVELCEWMMLDKAIRLFGEYPTPLRPGTLKELLTLGAIFPNLQRINRVAEIGSISCFSTGNDELCSNVELYENSKKKRMVEFDFPNSCLLDASTFYITVPI